MSKQPKKAVVSTNPGVPIQKAPAEGSEAVPPPGSVSKSYTSTELKSRALVQHDGKVTSISISQNMLWEVFLEILSGIIQGLNDSTESVVLQYLPVERLTELDDWKAFWGPEDFTRIMNLHCPLGVYIRAAPPSEFEEPETGNLLEGSSEGAMNGNPPPAVSKVSEVGFLHLYILPCIVNFYIQTPTIIKRGRGRPRKEPGTAPTHRKKTGSAPIARSTRKRGVTNSKKVLENNSIENASACTDAAKLRRKELKEHRLQWER
jgi:hypothetical protein